MECTVVCCYKMLVCLLIPVYSRFIDIQGTQRREPYFCDCMKIYLQLWLEFRSLQTVSFEMWYHERQRKINTLMPVLMTFIQGHAWLQECQKLCNYFSQSPGKAYRQNGQRQQRTEKVGGLWQRASLCRGRAQPRIDLKIFSSSRYNLVCCWNIWLC